MTKQSETDWKHFPCLFCNFNIEQPFPCFNNSNGSLKEEEKEESNRIVYHPSYFGITEEAKKLLQHLLSIHHLVIADAEKIAFLPDYLEYWKKEYEGKSIGEYASTIETQSCLGDVPQQYYLLGGGILPQDTSLRSKLQNDRLEYLLKKHQEERKIETFRRSCLFCSKFFMNRKEYFRHMFDTHSFNVGLPENLVNIDRFLDLLQDKINNHVCIYCEKTYPTMNTLHTHMRKKKHFKISGKNSIYDQYYIINYLEQGRNWEAIQSETDDSEDENQDTMVELSKEDNWDELDDIEDNDLVKCLFCDQIDRNLDKILSHMNNDHGFSIERIRKDLNLNFYECIRAVNFIRKEVDSLKCCYCGEKFDSNNNLKIHSELLSHCGVNRSSLDWKDDSYLIPFIKDDPLLRTIEGPYSDEEEESKVSGEEIDIESLASKRELLLDCL